MSLSSAGKYEVGNPAPSIRHQMGARPVSVGFLVPRMTEDAALTPFKVIRASDTTVLVKFGTVNDQPMTIGGTQLDAAPPPTLTISATTFVYLRLTIDDSTGQPTGGEIEVHTTPPSNTDSTAYVALARVFFGGGKITGISQGVTGSLWVRRCYYNTYNVSRV